MSPANACPTCGTALPDDAPEGAICEACALASPELVTEVAPVRAEEFAAEESPGVVEATATYVPLATIGEFEVIDQLGQGGMGTVYRARQISLERLVALKVLPAQVNDEDSIRRFQREATIAASVSHPNLVGVFASGYADGSHFIAMELVEGENLRQRLRRSGPLHPVEAVCVCREVARGLQCGWDRAQLIHRDIKPSNIYLAENGDVKLGDLGLAKSLLEETASLTETGAALGTAHYMSPEQARGEKSIDLRADIYSLGCTLYEALTGTTAYQGAKAVAIISQHLNAPVPAISRLLPGCPLPLVRLLGKMLKKQRQERHESYKALIAEMDRVIEFVEAGGIDPAAAARVGAWRGVANGPTLPTAGPTFVQKTIVAPRNKPRSIVLYGTIALFALVTVAFIALRKNPATNSAHLLVEEQTNDISKLDPPVAAPATPSPTSSVSAENQVDAPKTSSPLDVANSKEPPLSPNAVASETGKPVLIWKEVLPQIDMQRDRLQGQWRIENGQLVGGGNVKSNGSCALPISDLGEIDLLVELTTQSDAAVALFISQQGQNAAFILNGNRKRYSQIRHTAGLEMVDQQPLDLNPAAVERDDWLPAGKRHEIILQIRSQAVTALLNRQPVYRWVGDWKRLRAPGGWWDVGIKTKPRFAIGSQARSQITVHRFAWRSLGNPPVQTEAAVSGLSDNGAFPTSKTPPQSVNLIPNPSFEEIGPDGFSLHWQPKTWAGKPDWRVAGAEHARSGSRALHVIGNYGADAQTVASIPVKKGTAYRLSAWIKTKNVQRAEGALSPQGAFVSRSITDRGLDFAAAKPFLSAAVVGDRIWTNVEKVFVVENADEINIACAFGGWGQSVGEAWFDDVSLTEAAESKSPPTSQARQGTRQVKIRADDAFGYEVGAVRADQRISVRYIEGTWSMYGPNELVNPDFETFPAKNLGIFEIVDGQAKLLAGVPPSTASTTFSYRFEKDLPRVILRIQDGVVSDNFGAATWEVSLASSVEASAKLPAAPTPRSLEKTEVEIEAANPVGYELGAARKNQRLSLRYVKGLWSMDREKGSVNPDTNPFGGVRLGIFEIVDGATKLLADVPMGTERRAFHYRFEKDHPRVTLRIQDDVVGDNLGAVTYEVTFAPAGNEAAAGNTVANRSITSSMAPATATKNAAFTNSLGMKFVTVPITGGPTNGKRVLFSVWETRVQDYEVFASETNREWPKPAFPQGPTHPAVEVTWEDAQAFCKWLSGRERKWGRLRPNEVYRLPSDHEWSCAIGIGNQEDPTTVGEKKGVLLTKVYPWGSGWPPPANFGNYSGTETAGRELWNDQRHMDDYRDEFPATSPAGSFAANRFGLYDLSGNVRELCDGWWNDEQHERIGRRASFANEYAGTLQASYRRNYAPTTRDHDLGFRVVLAPEL